MSLYHIFSLIKIVAALAILISLYLTIDPYADPLVALTGLMIGFFLLGWGVSFFVFEWRYNHLKPQYTKIKPSDSTVTYSYRLSLLFGIYVLFNVIFLLREQRTILWWIAMLISFILIQNILLATKQNK